MGLPLGFLVRAEQGRLLLEVSRVKQAYEQVVGHVVPKSTVYRMLARHGWRKLTPPPRHPQAIEARQQGFRKLPAAVEACQGGRAALALDVPG